MAGGTVLSGERTGNAASTRSTNLVRCAPSLPLTDPSYRSYGKKKGTGGPQTDCSFFPGIPGPRKVRTGVCSPVISMAPGVWSVCRKARAFAAAGFWRRTSTWLPNKVAQCSSTEDTFEPNYLCVPLFIPCKLRYASWAVQGMVVTGNFRSAPDKWCSCLTVANVHINNKCAKRRSVCIAWLLLIRDLCLKLGAVLLTLRFQQGC